MKKPVYSPFVQRYRTQAYRLQRHKDAPAHGIMWMLLLALPLWLLIVIAVSRLVG